MNDLTLIPEPENSNPIAELAQRMFELKSAADETTYAIVMHADMFHFARAQVRSAMFTDCQRWLKRGISRRIRVNGFIRTPKPVYHGATA